MRTVFVTIFEGVEAKNILRTRALDKLLNAGLRIVLLTKSEERTKLYQSEFNFPGMVYEVLPYSRSIGFGLDRFFGRLKFILLRTDTTLLRRRLIFEHEKKYLGYYFGLVLNWILARPFWIRFFRALDYKFVKNDLYAKYFDKYNPELVFVAHLFEEPEIHLLREAKKRGIKTIGLINSWDKLTARCIMRLLPDKALVFNDYNKAEIIKYHLMDEKKVFTVGIPQYDFYYKAPYFSRDEFFKRIGIDPKKKLLVYAPAGSADSEADWVLMDILENMRKEGKFGKDVEILVRFQPNDFLNTKELEKRPHLVFDYPGMRFSSKRGIDWDMNMGDIKHLADTLYYMSMLICYGSSLSVDAAVVGRPIIHLNFEPVSGALPYKSPTRFYQFEHSKKAFFGGGARKVKSREELSLAINEYLADPSLDASLRKKMAEEQCKFLDGRSAERISDFILQEINSKIITS